MAVLHDLVKLAVGKQIGNIIDVWIILEIIVQTNYILVISDQIQGLNLAINRMELIILNQFCFVEFFHAVGDACCFVDPDEDFAVSAFSDSADLFVRAFGLHSIFDLAEGFWQNVVNLLLLRPFLYFMHEF